VNSIDDARNTHLRRPQYPHKRLRACHAGYALPPFFRSSIFFSTWSSPTIGFVTRFINPTGRNVLAQAVVLH
jgi:hypothetical protein